MRLPCELIRDLLPLYHDGVCSEASKTVVSEHLKVCPGCAATLKVLDDEMELPKLDADEARPLKAIKRKSLRRNILIGLTVFFAVLWGVLYLTVFSNMEMDPSEFHIDCIAELSDGRIYIEYSHPYTFTINSVDIRGTEDGAEYWVYHRPIWVFKANNGNQVAQRKIIDPAKYPVWYGYDKKTTITAFYLGDPNSGDAVLVWSKDMEVPKATPEAENSYLFGNLLE